MKMKDLIKKLTQKRNVEKITKNWRIYEKNNN